MLRILHRNRFSGAQAASLQSLIMRAVRQENFEAEGSKLSRMQNTPCCRKWGEKVSTKQVHFKYAETDTTNHQNPSRKGETVNPSKTFEGAKQSLLYT